MQTDTGTTAVIHECADAFVVARPPRGGPHLLLGERSDYPGEWTLYPDPREVLRAEWVYAASYGTVCQHLEWLGGRVWSAHEPMLRELLG